MRPMDQAAQIVPFVHTANRHAIAQSHRNAFGQVDVVRDQHRNAVTDVDDEALMTGTVIVIRQQPTNEARNLDPGTRIAFGE